MLLVPYSDGFLCVVISMFIRFGATMGMKAVKKNYRNTYGNTQLLACARVDSMFACQTGSRSLNFTVPQVSNPLWPASAACMRDVQKASLLYKHSVDTYSQKWQV